MLAAGLLFLVSALGASAEGPPKPRLAIVIDDFGLTYPKDVPDETWLALKWPITFAVMPESPRTKAAAKRTKETGHELIIHYPFDPFQSLELPKDKVSPKDEASVEKLLNKAFQQIPDAVGLNNHRSYRGTQNRPLMEAFMRLLKPRKVYFLDSKVSPKSVAYGEARKAGIPATSNDIFLDGTHEPKARRKGGDALKEAIAKDKAVCGKYLRIAANKARKTGSAVAIGHHYYHGTYECLAEAAPRLQKEGIELVFASALVR